MAKKLTPKQKLKKELDKKYESYLKQYTKAKEKYGYNLKSKLNKTNFVAAYEDYKSLGHKRPVSDMIKDQLRYSSTQSKVWVKNLKRNINKWSKESKSNLSDIQLKLIAESKKTDLSSKSFLMMNKKTKKIYDIINDSDAWDVAVGS